MTIRGTRSPTLTKAGDVRQTAAGVSVADTYEVARDTERSNVLSLFPPIGAAHPVYSGVTLSEITSRPEKAKDVVTLLYTGESSESPSGAALQVSGSPSMRESPITLHPKFLKWAGTPTSPKSGVFNEEGDFLGWQPSSPIYGVSAYLVPSVEISVTSQESSEPDLDQLGDIVASARGLPRVGGKRNWMIVAMPYSASGEGFSVTRVYMLSGKEGWSKIIYS